MQMMKYTVPSGPVSGKKPKQPNSFPVLAINNNSFS